jgi:hypothetical protein
VEGLLKDAPRSGRKPTINCASRKFQHAQNHPIRAH